MNKIIVGSMLLVMLCCVPQITYAKNVNAELSSAKVKVGKQIYVNSSTKEVTYSSSDPTIAYVNKEGVITGKKEGTVIIKVKRKGYKTKECALKVEKNSKYPSIPVVFDEIKLMEQKMDQDLDGNYVFSAVVKNNSQKGTIRKIEYYYEIEQAVLEPEQPTTGNEPQENDVNNEEVNEEIDNITSENENPESIIQNPEESITENVEDNIEDNKSIVYKRKTVVLTAKSVKPGETSNTISCMGDTSGTIESMKLLKVKLYTGQALYTYDARTGKYSLKWGTADKKAPVFSGWIEKNSYYNGCVLRICYSDRKNTYNFKNHVKAVDDRDGNVKIIVDTSKINWKKEGVYKIIYTAKDSAGNTAKTWAKVQVFKKGTAEAIADDVLKSITEKNWSDEKKLRAIYGYVKRHCSYVDNASHSDWRARAVSGIRYQSGDCFTYYSVSRLLITRAGIPNIMIQRYPAHAGHNHWWNLVYVRGGWYHFDTTPRRRPGKFCLVTDAQLRNYSTDNTFSFNKNLYPSRATKRISPNP